MFDITYYIFIWLLLCIMVVPVMLVSALVVVIGNLGDVEKKRAKRLEQFKKIDFLLGILNNPSSNKENLAEALEAFKKNHATFGNIDVNSQEARKRIEFIGKVTSTELFDIDSASRWRDELGSRNANFKKEIEQTISASLKNREKGKK